MTTPVRITVPRPPQPTGRSGFPVWNCPGCTLPNDMLRASCRKCQAHRPCEHWVGERHCGAVPVHMYTVGPRCDPHSPAALRRARETSHATSPTREKEAA